jgi:hypothetical protein
LPYNTVNDNIKTWVFSTFFAAPNTLRMPFCLVPIQSYDRAPRKGLGA